jgi:Flp pilus assembly protein TadG
MNGQEMRFEWKKEAGQSIVLIALAMVVLLAMVGLILDGGQVYFTRRNSQNTADAAAYAGARVFSVRPDNTSASTALIWNAITTYTAANYVPNANNVTAWYVDASNNNLSQINQSPFPAVDAQATGVRVYVVQQFQPTFISLVRGNAPLDVPARATVEVGPLQAPQQLMPVAIITTTPDIQYNTLFTMEGTTTGSGNYQWIDFGLSQCNGQGGANILSQLLSIPQGCSPPPVVADDPAPNSQSWINSKPGLSPNNNVTTALNEWMALPQSDRLWLIPITWCIGDPSYGWPAGCGQNVNGSNVYYYTWAFGEFELLGYKWNNKCYNNDCTPLAACPDINNSQVKDFICGSFVKFNATGSPGTPGACNTNGLNVCAMELTE